MWQGFLGAKRWRGTIVLVVFGQIGISVGELRNFGLVGVGGYHGWLDYGVDILYQYLIHPLQFFYVSHKVRRDG